jgi:type I restriction enzyme, S subunit
VSLSASAPKLKPVNRNWIRAVPPHWDTALLKLVARLESGHTPSRAVPQYWENCTIPWFTLGDVWQLREERRKYVTETAELVSELGLANSSARLLPAGTVMLSRTASVGFTGIMGRAMATTQDFVNWVCGPKLRPEYLWYCLQAMTPEYDRLRFGSTHHTIYMPDIAQFKVPVPPLAEQARIAAFLDEHIARIDALITEKERLKATLEEWRGAELTRICFGNAASGDTGNPWLPKLPKDWRPARLKHLVTGIEQGWSPECEARLAEDGEWGVLKAGASNGGVFRDTEHKALPSHMEPLPELEVHPGDVIVSRASGSADLVGSFAYVEQTRPRLMLSDKNFRLKFGENAPLLPELVSWICNTPVLREQVRQYVSGAEGLAKNIGSGSLRELWLPVPPPAAQAQMLAELHTVTERLASLRQHLLLHIERLREYRSSLISAAVTGQLDLGDSKTAVRSGSQHELPSHQHRNLPSHR